MLRYAGHWQKFDKNFFTNFETRKYVMLDYYYSMKYIHIFVIAIVVTLLAKGNAIKSNKTDVLWPLPASYSFEMEG